MGFPREMILMNGKFPGPLVEVWQDDWVEITVANKMPFNTTIHAHGIEQFRTPWADGVPGLSQRPIQPNDNFTYKWQATQYGSYFYHAHSRGQIDDGAYGPIIIRPPNIPVVVSDRRHTTSERTWELELASGLESAICMDALLVNGKGAVDCWPREQITQFTNPGLVPLFQENNLQMTDKGPNIDALPDEVFNICTPTQGSRRIIKTPSSAKWIAFEIISAPGFDSLVLSIDEHSLWVYAVDGHYIEPLKVDVLTLFNGDRYSVLVQLDKSVANYGIRVASTALTQLIDTTAVFAYDRSSTGEGLYTVNSTPSINRAGGNASVDVTVFNEAKMVSFPPQFLQPAPNVDRTFIMTFDKVGKSFIWALNESVFNPAIDDSNPPLLYQQPSASNPGGNITITTKNNTWVDLIFTVVTLNQPPHPIHKHSSKFFINGQGEGAFNWTSVADAAAAIPENFNLVTPPLRDGCVTLPTVTKPTWLAVRYHVVNPGAWMLDCHIQSHLNGGMAMVILDGMDEWPEVPEDCKN
ncbi:multicopper oxidase [Lentithecium fluviatile CBS 122367]|uniref:Multicopper oxidase n=1 Tax=Lentithecium fluviatile CBS 122367 TaxID=1168545 RepID=A0A6G1JI62_9PLEO|nr:multicopper oxidase [Lentithecium fluviatile CBS 122367]